MAEEPKVQTATPIEINTPTLNTIKSEPECQNPELLLQSNPNYFLPSPVAVDPKRRFLCPVEGCNKAYGKSSHLRSHITWHSGEKPFICLQPFCMRGFTRSDELARHTRTHTGEKPYGCTQCRKRFTRSDHLTKHLRVHIKHGKIDITPMLEVSLSEEQTGMEPPAVDNFSPVPPLGAHEIDTKSLNHFVNGCGNILETSLQEQKETINIKSEYDITIEAEKNSNQATSSFTSNIPISKHSILTQMLETPGSVSKKIKTESMFVEKRYQCSEIGCGKAFKRQDELKRHNRIHSGEKPFACEQCEKKFLRSDHLKKHIKTHNRALSKLSS